MARRVDVMQIQEERVRAFKLGDEEKARTLILQLGTGPRQVRAVLEAMLKRPEGLVRQVAAFGLGELGGAASVRRLEEQLAIEEARGDYDGSAVVEDITRALGRLKGARARGWTEDAAFLEAHCPAEPVLAKIFRDAARCCVTCGRTDSAGVFELSQRIVRW